MVAGYLCAFSGFGHGNIFNRMESSSSLVPGSDSDVVAQKNTVKHSGEKITALFTGVSLENATDTVESLTKNIANIANISQVFDPIKINSEFKRKLDAERKEAISKAVANAEPEINAAIQQTLKAQERQLKSLPAAQRAEVESEIAQKVRQQATNEVETKVAAKIATEFAKITNPASRFTPKGDPAGKTGFAIIIQLKPGEHSDTHQQVQSLLEKAKIELRNSGNQNANIETISSSIISDVILQQVANDLIRGETFGLPVALLLMILVFGGILAASLPILAAIVAIGISMGIIWGITFTLNVDSFVLNILTIIGLALSIDYGLLIVSRYREIIQQKIVESGFSLTELKENKTKLKSIISESVSETVLTAGRTVSFSAITITVAIAGLFMIKAPMIQMIAVGGVIVTLFAVLTSVTFVPAMIVLLGYRLLQPSPLGKIPGFAFLFRHLGDASAKRGIFSNLAHWVHGRPWRILIIVTSILIIASIPIKGLEMRSNVIEYVPENNPVAKTMDLINKDYPEFQNPDILLYTTAKPEKAEKIVKDVEKLEHVERVGTPIAKDAGSMISIYTDANDSVGKEVTQLVSELRAKNFDAPVYVGGAAAMQLDFRNEIYSGAIYAAIVIVLAVFILLFLLTGSLFVPLKALIINTLSLISSTGIAIFIFQNGLFGMPVSQGLETFVVACAAAFGFGLAMDYEVFLIARIKEYWDSGMDNDSAVEYGLQQSGRIITAAAAIIIAVFIGFSLGDLLPIKQIGVVLAVIVFVDATLVRMLLVPALMTLMGRWNWWAPKHLTKIYEKFKIVH